MIRPLENVPEWDQLLDLFEDVRDIEGSCTGVSSMWLQCWLPAMADIAPGYWSTEAMATWATVAPSRSPSAQWERQR